MWFRNSTQVLFAGSFPPAMHVQQSSHFLTPAHSRLQLRVLHSMIRHSTIIVSPLLAFSLVFCPLRHDLVGTCVVRKRKRDHIGNVTVNCTTAGNLFQLPPAFSGRDLHVSCSTVLLLAPFFFDKGLLLLGSAITTRPLHNKMYTAVQEFMVQNKGKMHIVASNCKSPK
jgi:hypothetical protein